MRLQAYGFNVIRPNGCRPRKRERRTKPVVETAHVPATSEQLTAVREDLAELYAKEPALYEACKEDVQAFLRGERGKGRAWDTVKLICEKHGLVFDPA